MEITKNTEKIFQYLTAIVIIIGFFLILFVSINSDKDIDNMLTGALVGAFTTIVGFYYGSSKGSADKNEMINGKGKENAK